MALMQKMIQKIMQDSDAPGQVQQPVQLQQPVQKEEEEEEKYEPEIEFCEKTH